MSARTLRSSRTGTPQTPTPTPRRQRPVPTLAPPCVGEVYHRDHSLISFEWQLQGLEWLQRSLDEVPISGWTTDHLDNKEVVPELMRGGVIIGEGWYKLDLGRSLGSHSAEAALDTPNSLSLYITSPTLDSAPLDYTFSSAIFVGIRPSNPNIGQRYSHTRWIWHMTTDHEFTKESEYAAIALPPLDELLGMQAVKEENGFTLCVQIGSPLKQKPGFTMPGEVIAPNCLLEGLGALLDSTTGDVQFVCLQHVDGEARKRTIYAHSEILKARSEYFRSLLSGGFKETEGKRVVVVVDDADFDTVYWLLHFIYCNELLFTDQEDVRQLMNRLNLDRKSVQRVLSGRKSGEWDLKTIPTEEEEMTASISGLTSSSNASTGIRSPPPERVPSALVSAVTSRRLKQTPPTPNKALPNSPTGHLLRAFPDPHPHPTPKPPPASALAVFMLSHRYRLEPLEDLAKESILKGLTVDNCMPMLFATHAYDKLHIEVLNYVVENFGLVQLSQEFGACIKEVSTGVWGETGGEVLVGLFKRL